MDKLLYRMLKLTKELGSITQKQLRDKSLLGEEFKDLSQSVINDTAKKTGAYLDNDYTNVNPVDNFILNAKGEQFIYDWEHPTPLVNIDNSVKAGRDVIAEKGSIIAPQSSFDNARINPSIETTVNTTPNSPKKRSLLEIIMWIVGIISGLVLIYEFIIKQFLS